MAEVKIDISDANINRLMFKTAALVDYVSMSTNIDTDDFIQKIGAQASWYASSYIQSNLKKGKFASRQPKKLWRRKLVDQRYVKKYMNGGVWYAPTGEARQSSGKKKKKNANPILSQFAKKRKKFRKDPKQPFFVPAPIPGAERKGLRQVKMLIYLRGNRRKGRFGTLPSLENEAERDRRSWIRNTASAKLGWQRALKKIPKALGATKSEGDIGRLPNHQARRGKNRVRHKAATRSSGAEIKITNFVEYVTDIKGGKDSDRRAMVKAMNWFNGYWGKRKNIAIDHYRRKYGDIVK